MNLQHVLEESELGSHIEKFQFSLKSAETEFQRMLETELSSSRTILQDRQSKIQYLRKFPADLENLEKSLESVKPDEDLLLSHVPNESSKIADGQIFFQGEHTKALNFIPYCIVCLVFLKIWIAPLMALMMPLILAVVPYILIKTLMDIDIPWEAYKIIMKKMVFGIQSDEPWKPKHYMQILWTLASLGQSIVSPFMTAYHTANLDAEIVKRGEALIHLHTVAKGCLHHLNHLGSNLFETLILPEIPGEPHEAVAWMDSEPLGMKQLWKVLGRLAIYIKIAKDDSWSSVGLNGSLTLENLSDLAISSEKSVKSAVNLKGHGLLTGPNRGGKSSALRAILQQIVLGQVTGFTYMARGSWGPFALIFSRLKSRDTAGKESLFEMEVRHASKILSTINRVKKNTLVLIDELFHSTNPPDAETSAKLFLQLLWKHPNVKSIISTHIFSLCDATQNTTPIQTFRCNAEEKPDGSLDYSYKITEGGVCRVSSVKEVLKEAGMVDVRLIQS
jgi:hypothetical protein